MLTSLSGRVAIVTGASRGIGRGIARVFAAQGARVLVVARSAQRAQPVVDEIVARGGVASAFAADVVDPAAQEAMARAAAERYGGLDVLCANAGVFPSSPLAEMTPAQWDEVLDANLKGTFLSVSACLPELKRRGKGRIVVISSITGPMTAYPGWSHYAASKAGQLGFVRAAALELSPFGITVNAVLPGNIATESVEALGEEYSRQMLASIPARRLGTVEDIAYAASFLASDEASFITGQTLVVDGGQTLPESPAALAMLQG
ncbi:3-oxoacyl-ACP reductase FabG [Sorangium sp. So ce1128]